MLKLNIVDGAGRLLEFIKEAFGAEPAAMAAILRSQGFCVIEDINFQAIASRFGQAVQALAPGHAGVHVVHDKH